MCINCSFVSYSRLSGGQLSRMTASVHLVLRSGDGMDVGIVAYTSTTWEVRSFQGILMDQKSDTKIKKKVISFIFIRTSNNLY